MARVSGRRRSVLGCSEHPSTVARCLYPPPHQPPSASASLCFSYSMSFLLSPSVRADQHLFPHPCCSLSPSRGHPWHGTGGAPGCSAGSWAGSSWWYRNRSHSAGDPIVHPLRIVPSSLPTPGGASRCQGQCCPNVPSLQGPCLQQSLFFFWPVDL